MSYVKDSVGGLCVVVLLAWLSQFEILLSIASLTSLSCVEITVAAKTIHFFVCNILFVAVLIYMRRHQKVCCHRHHLEIIINACQHWYQHVVSRCQKYCRCHCHGGEERLSLNKSRP